MLLYYSVLLTATNMVVFGIYHLIGWEVSAIVLGLVLFIVARDAKDDGLFDFKDGDEGEKLIEDVENRIRNKE